jgi:predicted NACHT family NTPase
MILPSTTSCLNPIMAKRSLKASPDGIQKAKQAFERREWTQEYLASTVGLQTRQSVWKFFTGRPIERYLFIDICFQLNLEWEEIADLPRFDEVEVVPLKVDKSYSTESKAYLDTWNNLKQRVRQNICHHYSALIQLRDLPEAVSLSDIYIERNIIGSYNHRRWLAADELHDRFEYPQYADLREMPFRFASALFQSATEIETRPKKQSLTREIPLKEFLLKKRHIHLLGETGTGKSVTLQGLACQLNQDDQLDMVSCFLPLRSLSVSPEDLESTIIKVLRQQGFTELTFDFWQWLCQAGKVCLLFDGINEVTLEDRTRIATGIRDLVSQYPNILTTVSSRYVKSNINLQGFHTATLANLNKIQIQQFACQWFDAVVASASIIPQAALNDREPLAKQYADQFLQEVQQKQNYRLYNIAQTPLMLHLLCIHFYFQQRLPKSRTRFYEYVLQTWLDQSGAASAIGLENLYSVKSSSDLTELLGQVALTAFKSGSYFFEKPTLIEAISDRIAQVTQQTEQSIEPDLLWHQTNHLLNFLLEQQDVFIEIAQGVYTFSQPALQEYLCATILANRLLLQKINTDQSSYLPQQWLQLDQQARWHEVIYLTLQLSANPQLVILSLQESINIEIQSQLRDSDFLPWISARTLWMAQQDCTLSASVIRAIYFGVSLDLGFDLAYMLHADLSLDIPRELKQDMAVIQLISSIPLLVEAPTYTTSVDFSSKLQLVASIDHSSSLQAAMQTLQDKITQSALEQWPEAERKTWGQKLYNDLSQCIEFSGEWVHRARDLIQLENYYWANVFLLKCQSELNQANSSSLISEKILCSSG